MMQRFLLLLMGQLESSGQPDGSEVQLSRATVTAVQLSRISGRFLSPFAQNALKSTHNTCMYENFSAVSTRLVAKTYSLLKKCACVSIACILTF